MCGRLNGLLSDVAPELAPLDADEITRTLTRGALRERHLAKALRLAVCDTIADDAGRRALLERIFGGRALRSSLDDAAEVENEIRANLLKAGGAAFVAETRAAFMPVDDVVALIGAAGGIATYPFLGDDAEGRFTAFEADLPAAAASLQARGIHSVEFISPRNSAAVLERYAAELWDAGFIATLGSEHNTPARDPLLLTTRGGAPLTPRLREINYLGACALAGHQAYFARHSDPYDPEFRDDYVALGHKVIQQRLYE